MYVNINSCRHSYRKGTPEVFGKSSTRFFTSNAFNCFKCCLLRVTIIIMRHIL